MTSVVVILSESVKTDRTWTAAVKWAQSLFPQELWESNTVDIYGFESEGDKQASGASSKEELASDKA